VANNEQFKHVIRITHKVSSRIQDTNKAARETSNFRYDDNSNYQLNGKEITNIIVLSSTVQGGKKKKMTGSVEIEYCSM